MRGAAVSMNESFRDFGLGLLISIALVYLILMAQFASFIDPFIILMAIPPGLAGVVMILLFTGSTLNIMSLMGVIMMTGIVVSNSILIVEFSGILHEQGLPLLEATVQACKVRLRPILMTSLATLLGMIPMALGLEAGSEQYAPLARAIIGGLGVSVVVTVFLVPAVYLVIHTRRERKQGCSTGGPGMRMPAWQSLASAPGAGSSCAVPSDCGCAAQRARSDHQSYPPRLRPPSRSFRVADDTSPGSRRNKRRSRITRASASASCWHWRNTRWCGRRGPRNCPQPMAPSPRRRRWTEAVSLPGR